MSIRKRLLCTIMVLVMIFSITPLDNDIHVHADNYKTWSQSDSRWSGVNIGSKTVGVIGCTSMAVTKMAIQAGVKNPSTFNVATFVELMNANNGYTSERDLKWNVAGNVVGLTDCGFLTTSGNHYLDSYTQSVISWINQGYHLILNVPTSNGHWVVVDEEMTLSTGQVCIMDNGYNGLMSNLYSYFMYCRAYKGGSTPTGDRPPEGFLDEVEYVGDNSIRVKGWAFDPDQVDQSIIVHVYIGGIAGDVSAEGYSVNANVYRSDVDERVHIGGYHGFETVLETNLVGTQYVYVYGINLSSTSGSNKELNSSGMQVTIGDKMNIPQFYAIVTNENDGTSLYQEDSANVKGKVYSDEERDRFLWNFERYEDGTYKITNMYNSKVLDCWGAGTDNGTNIVAHDPNESNAQKWTIYKRSNGSYAFEPVCAPGSMLDDGGEGRNVHLWKCVANKEIHNQNFNLNIVSQQNLCTHQWEKTSVTNPSCSVEGYEYYKCSKCGDTKQETINALGHSWDNGKITKAATCTEEGIKTFTCTREGCNETKTEKINTVGHTEEIIAAKAATCTEKGNTAGKKCSVCGELLEGTTEIPALGHSWDNGKITLNATCTEDGEKAYSCTREGCDGKKTEVIKASGHTVQNIPAVEATCLNNGKTAGKKCSVCGEIIEAPQNVAALGHSWDNGRVTKAPTCTEDGERTYACRRYGCNATYTEIIDALGHTEETILAVEATCTTKGKTAGKKCSVCGEIIEGATEIAALGHSWDNGRITKKATCTEDGEKVYTCTRDGCSETKTETIKATGHVEEIIPAVKATCTTKGKTAGKKCSVCGELLESTTEIAALGHSWDNGRITLVATCTEDGEKVCKCTRQGCQETKTEVIKASGHDEVVIPAVESTCVNKGKTAGKKCASCGEILESPKMVAALGHSWDKGRITKEATCTENGEKTFTCRRYGCKTTRTEVVNALGHDEEIIPGKAATYTHTGLSEGSYCTVCGDVIKEQKVIPYLSGLYKSPTDGEWYYMCDGKINKTFTGIVKNNEDGIWYFVRNGKMDKTYNGVAQATNGIWYYVTKGKIDRTFTGKIAPATNGRLYYVNKGKPTKNFDQKIAYCPADGKYYYCTNGRVDRSFSGKLAYCTDGNWYYVKKGMIDKKFTGIAEATNGKMYYAKNGKLDKSFSGTITYEGKTYKVVKGAVK